MPRLMQSAKFWTLVLDVVLSLITYFVGKYAAPETGADVLYAVAAIQPIFIVLIAAYAAEDIASKRGVQLTLTKDDEDEIR